MQNEEKLKVGSDKVDPPSWLCKNGKKVFRRTRNELKKIDLVQNLDINTLAIYSDNVVKYAEFEDTLRKMSELLEEANEIEDVLERLKMKDKINKQIVNMTTKKLQIGDAIRKFAVEFGLTPQSRARLAIPREKEEKPKSQFDEIFGDV